MEGAAPGQRASAPLLRLGWNRRVDREGYAFPVRRTDNTGSYDSWGYPPLEADFSSHFVADLFGDLHDFQLEVGDEEGWILHFCAREQDDPYLDGVLEVGPDTLIYRAEWRFYTDEPDEGAGGWARFPPVVNGDTSPPLLPSESLTWKGLPNGQIRAASSVVRGLDHRGRGFGSLPPGASIKLSHRATLATASISTPTALGSSPT